MAVHWVNYDLNKTGQNYTQLIEYLKSHQSWAKPLASSFFVKTSLTAGQLRDGIKKHVDGNDSIVVVNVTGQGWGTSNVDSNGLFTLERGVLLEHGFGSVGVSA